MIPVLSFGVIDMRIGVPREIKTHEYRVGITPAGARELVERGHVLLVESGAGVSIGLSDEDYRSAGATIVAGAGAGAGAAARVWAEAELLVKVKEPMAQEHAFLRRDLSVFAYLHLAAEATLTRALIDSGCTAIAYETVRDADGGLPLLAPMSEVAGRMSIQAGAHALEKAQGGIGLLLGGVPGVAPAHVVILGGGVVGYNAALIAVGMGARVTVLDRNLARLAWLDSVFRGRVTTLHATPGSIEQAAVSADLLIGAVLVPGAVAPKLVRRELLGRMRPGTVLVDVAIDQGGCFESSRPTTHDSPTYIEQGVVHYCVSNIPGAVARTATFALANATLPYVMRLAESDVTTALRADPGLLAGLNVHANQLCNAEVGRALELPAVEPLAALAAGDQ
jgi:alanine dehydrogenase